MLVILPICKSIFNVIAGRVDKYTALVPGSTLHSDILMYSTQVLKLSVTNGYH